MNAGPLWVTKIKDLVHEAVDQVPDRGQQSRRLAAVHPDPELGPGWFVVHHRLTTEQVENVEAGYLRHGTDRVGREYGVIEVVVAGDAVRVRTSVVAPQTALDLYVPAADQRRILTGLAEGLEVVRDSPLLATFAQKKLTPLPVGDDLSSVHGWDELRSAQKQAVIACCASGLHLVWAPPGTGKTRVIAAALSHLASTGRRVLLVSAINIAVDTATQQTVQIMQPGSGEVLRIGTIHLPALAADERVNLGRLVELRQSELHQRAAALDSHILALTEADVALSTACAQITGFDAVEYRRAGQRVANRAAQERQQHDLGSAEEDVAEALADLIGYQALLLSLACREAVEQDVHTRTELAIVDAELATLKRHAWNRIRRFRAIARGQADRQELIDKLAQTGSALSTALTAARNAAVAPEACGKLSRQEIEAGRDSATGRLKAAETRLADLHHEFARLNTLDLGSPLDQSQVTDQWPLWKLHTNLPALRERAEQERRQREPIERQYEQVQEQISQDRRAIEQSLVAQAQVVATTFTQIALRPWLTAEPFDHVIIDEAVAAQFPHLVHALGHARVGAVLIGDYLQNGPIVDAEFPAGAQVRGLFKRDCFAFLGATNPAEATPGCVALTEQFRFGPALTELVNHVAYDNVLELTSKGATRTEGTDLVVVTVDGLPPALRTTYHADKTQSGWWAIGALLAQALTDHHQDGRSSAALAVVVPYPPQVETTRAVVAEAGTALTPIGTPDSFQSRQFGTVLADLVEDGGGRVDGTRLDEANALADIRRFTVAATRARGRLYLLLTDRALAAAHSGPLSVLPDLITAGTVRRVNIPDLIGLSPTESADERLAEGSPEADLLAALEPYVRRYGPHTEDAVIEEVVAQITKATMSVWCWNAWEGRHAVTISEALEQAHLRGVDVRLICPPMDQVPASNQRHIADLLDQLPDLVFMRDLQQKIVITDRRWSIIGERSQNPYPPGEFMIAMENAAFAEQLLTQEMSDELGRQRRCRQCDEPLRECRQRQETGKEPKRRWIWLCPNNHPTPFPDSRRSASRDHHRWAPPGWGRAGST